MGGTSRDRSEHCPRLRRPPRLREGDTVALVAPAGPLPADLLDAGVEQLKSWGLHVRVGTSALDRHPELTYLAGRDEDRAADLQRAWCDPRIAGVLCARGGYGSMRLLGHLDWTAMARSPTKVLVGSSDVTSLHEAFAAHLGVVTLFGPMPATEAFVDDALAREQLRRTLFEPEKATVLTRPAAHTVVPGRAVGITYGGNLSVLAGMLGSVNTRQPPERGIAVLEDVTEAPYRLDRFLGQLRRAGWFDTAAGIALGSWHDCGPHEQVRAVLLDVLGDLGVPVVDELGFGHCPEQHTIALGVTAELDTDPARLSTDQPALV